MLIGIKKADASSEFDTQERCLILEIANDPDDDLSISRARVRPGITTEWHRLVGIDERYVVTDGTGLMEMTGWPKTPVSAGAVVRIPAGTAQRVTNIGTTDLVFYCVCSPRFRPEAYEVATNLEPGNE